MSDPSLSRGENWVLCCICFKTHLAPYEDLARDESGHLTDVCKGQCAVDAGIVLIDTTDLETPPETIFDWQIDTPIDEILGQALGAASVCWSNPAGAGTFDIDRALKIQGELRDILYRKLLS